MRVLGGRLFVGWKYFEQVGCLLNRETWTHRIDTCWVGEAGAVLVLWTYSKMKDLSLFDSFSFSIS